MRARLLASIALICLLLAATTGAWAQDSIPGSTAIIDQTTTPQPPPPVATPEPPVPQSADSPGFLPEGTRMEDLAAPAGDDSTEPAAADAQVTSALTPGGFLYVLRASASANYIDRFSADAATGVLTLLGSTPTGGTGGAGSSAHLLAYDATNYRLYALNDVSSTISAYSVDRSTGWLTPLPFSPISLGAGAWSSLVVHPSGTPLVAANRYSGSYLLASYNITVTATNGTPRLQAPSAGTFSTGVIGAYSLAFSRDGEYLYGGGNDGTAFFGFRVNPSSGQLSALDGSPYDTGLAFPTSYATDATGRLYLSGYVNGVIKAATTSSGIPTIVASLSSTQMSQAVDGLVHPSGYYLIADRTNNQVGVFKINISPSGTSFATVSGSPFATGGTSTQALAISASGSAVYAANATSRTVTRFLFNAANGALSSPLITATPTGGVLQGIAYARYNPPASTGGFLFALRRAADGYNYIDCYTADAEGRLTLRSSTPTNKKANGFTVPHDLAYDPINARLYALNDDLTAPSVSIYSVNPTNGALTPYLSPINLAAGYYYGLAVHPSGSPLLAVQWTSITSYNITPTGATLAAGSPYTTGAAYPFDLVFSQDGNYFYTGGNLGSTMAGFSVNPSTGVLTALSGSPFDIGTYTTGLATDSLGRLFMTNVSPSSAKVLTTTTGVPATVNTLSVSGVGEPFFGMLHPAGFYMVADRMTNKVFVFRVDGSGAGSTLAAVPGSPFVTGGTYTHFLALNETGKALYAGNMNSATITRFQINPFTGALTNLDTTDLADPSSRLMGLAYVPKVIPSSFFYALHDSASGSLLYGYRLDKVTGSLTLLSGFPVVTGSVGGGSGWHQMLAIDELNYRLYAVATTSKHLLAYSINPYTGALTAMPFSPYNLGGTTELSSVAVHPSGSPVVVGRSSNQVQSFNVTATNISPALGVTSLGGSGNLTAQTFTPDGRFLYTGENAMFALSVNQATGELSLVPGAPFYTSDGIQIPASAESTGRLFSSLFSSSIIRASTLDATGVPTPVMNTSPLGIYDCLHSALHPAGYLVIGCYGNHRVGSFKISGSGTSTSLFTTGYGAMQSFGSNPATVKFDRTGRWLATVNAVTNNLISYAFDPATGALAPASWQPIGTAGKYGGGYDTGFGSVPAWPGPYLPVVNR